MMPDSIFDRLKRSDFGKSGLVAIGAAFLLLTVHAGCRGEVGGEGPGSGPGQFLAFSTLNDQLQFSDAGYGATLLLDDDIGLKGAVAFRANEEGTNRLVLIEFDSTGGSLELRKQFLAENVGDIFKMRRDPASGRRIIAGSFLAPGGTANVGVVVETGTDWKLHLLDQTDDNGRYVDCAVDETGAIHVAYVGSGDRSLRYVHWQDGVFLTQPSHVVTVDKGIDDNQGGPGGGIDSAVALDLTPDGEPAISYYDGGRGQLRVAVLNRADLTWRIQVVGGAIAQKVLAVDADGVALVSESFVPRKSQLVLYRNLQPLDASAFTIESNTRIRILEYDATAEYQLDFVVPVSINYGGWSSLKVLQSGALAVAFQDFRGGRLMFAQNEDFNAGGKWTIETVDQDGIVGGVPALAVMPFFDDEGIQRGELPVVAYQDIGNSDLKLAFRADKGWRYRRLVSPGLTGFGPSLVTTADGNVVIAYREHRIDEGFSANLQVTRAVPVQP